MSYIYIYDSSLRVNNFIFVNRFSKNYQICDVMKICPEGADLSHADGRGDLSRFSQFCERA